MSISYQPAPASVLSGLAPEEQLEKIDQAYSSPPWWYNLRGLAILTFTYRSTLWTQVRHFAGNVADRHLEVAVGTGTFLGLVLGWRRLAGAPRVRVAGLDCAEAMLAGARRRFRKDPNVELVKGDAAALDLPADSFASANVPNAMHCFPRVDAVLAEIFRVLTPGGTLAANVLLHPRGIQPFRWIAERINAWAMRKGILHTPYELEDIRARFRKVGFEIVRERVVGNTWMVCARKPVQSHSGQGSSRD
ncbi:MAG TPA: methyltransferase domain-containing protein [Planctomycetota bacterium]|nr:methyltransferase domain-containing protein [Planctomycetota bacterium]